MRKSARFISQLSHAGKMPSRYRHHSHILGWDREPSPDVWEEKPRWKGHYRMHRPTASVAPPHLPSPEGKSQISKQNQTEIQPNKQFIGQNRRSGKTGGWIMFKLTGRSSLGTVFLGGFSLLVSDPAPIKGNENVVMNHPQHWERERCLWQRPWCFFTL